MSPRVVLLAGLALLTAGCLVESGTDGSDPSLDTQSSALDTATPVPPAGDPATAGGAQPGLGAPITPGSPYPKDKSAEDPTKPSPDPWGGGLNISPASTSGVAVSPTTSKKAQ